MLRVMAASPAEVHSVKSSVKDSAVSSTSGTLTAHSKIALAGTAALLAQQEEKAGVMFEEG